MTRDPMCRRRGTAWRLLPVIAAVVMSAACSGEPDGKTRTLSGSSSAKPSGTTAAKPPPVNPLTGVGRPPTNPAIAIKIDDVPAAHPQAGVEQADVVYIEQVEYGLTRLMGVFSSRQPVVGPVRSVRTNDPEILGPYGSIAFGASGGAAHSVKAVNDSALRVVMDGNSNLYVRDGSRPAPHNLFVDSRKLAASAPGAKPAKNVGFAWDASAAAVRGRPGATRIDTTVGNTPVSFRYNATTRKYTRYIGGNPSITAGGSPVATPNVIVQACLVTVDPNNSASTWSHTIGKGKVAVFRNGVRIDGTWERRALTAPTSYKDARGRPITLNPGGVWVVLVAHTVAVRSS